MDQQKQPDSPDVLRFQRSLNDPRRKLDDPRKGEDLYCQLAITFEEAALGCQKEIELPCWGTCLHCQGSGAQHSTSRIPCSTCGKVGETRRIQESIFGPFLFVTRCTDCQGEGWLVTTPCDQCRSQGRVPNYQLVTVNISAGTDDGIKVCLKDKGHIGIRGGSPGDLYVMVAVKPHIYFKRQGNDVLRILPISFVQAILGDEVEIRTLDGNTTPIKIPAGTQNDQSFTLKGMGLPVEHGSNYGDMHVIIRVETPSSLLAEEEVIFREFDHQMKLKRRELQSKVGSQ